MKFSLQFAFDLKYSSSSTCMNEDVKVFSCQELVHFALWYPSIVIVRQFFLHLFANHQFRETTPVMSVEEVRPHTFQVRNLFILFLSHSEVSQRMDLGNVSWVLDSPLAASHVHEQILLPAQECLTQEHFTHWELPLLSILIANQKVCSILCCIVNWAPVWTIRINFGVVLRSCTVRVHFSCGRVCVLMSWVVV